MTYSFEDQECHVSRLHDARCLTACRHVLPGEGLYPRLNGRRYKYMPHLLEAFPQGKSRLQFTRAGWIVVFSLIATLTETLENRLVPKPNAIANPKQKRNSRLLHDSILLSPNFPIFFDIIFTCWEKNAQKCSLSMNYAVMPL